MKFVLGNKRGFCGSYLIFTSASNMLAYFHVLHDALNKLKNRDKILREFETNGPSSKQRGARKTGNEEINKLIWEWFKDMSRRTLPILGPMLQEKALQFAKDLGNTKFKASDGWLESFRKHNNIGFYIKVVKKPMLT